MEIANHCMICLTCARVLKQRKGATPDSIIVDLQAETSTLSGTESQENSVLRTWSERRSGKTLFRHFWIQRMLVLTKWLVSSILQETCTVETLKWIHPDEENDSVAITLSHDAVLRQQCSIVEQLRQSLLTKVRRSKTLLTDREWLKWAVYYSAQLLIFIRCLSQNFETHEDFLSMESLNSNTQEADIHQPVKKFWLKSDMTCLRDICTDDAPVVVGYLYKELSRVQLSTR